MQHIVSRAVKATEDPTVSAYDAVLLVKSDATVFPPCRGLYVGTTGDLNVVMASGATVLFSTVPVGILPIQIIQLLSTSTTAATVVALY